MSARAQGPHLGILPGHATGGSRRSSDEKTASLTPDPCTLRLLFLRRTATGRDLAGAP